MESNYSSKYSGELVDAAVEYFLRHSQSEGEDSSYEYTNTVFCKNSTFPSKPFDDTKLPTPMPGSFPFTGTDGSAWYDVPIDSDKNWYQCVLKINFKSKKVVAQGAVIDMRGATGPAGNDGQNGNNGQNGENGEDGKDGNYVEFRWKRASQYAITLTDTQKTSRYPAGWTTDINTADVETLATIKSLTCTTFDKFLILFSSTTATVSTAEKFFTELSATPDFTAIANKFKSLHGVDLVALNNVQENLIVEAYGEFRTLYDKCSISTSNALECNTEYHRLYTKYVDENHFWVLFMIQATIDGETDSLVSLWSTPQRIQGEDGKPGPSGSNGIDGIPGINIGVAFTLGTETGPRPDAANPLVSPYKDSYKALLASGTRWTTYTPEISTTYPYIWFTQCRYQVYTDREGNDTYTMEDSWSAPARYTGLNGVTTHETVYTRNPIIYPAGIYSDTATYSNDGYRAPYVYYNNHYYYLSGQGSISGASPTNSTWWTLMESFEALFAKVGIIANGLIGSAVFNGNYMFSQQGVDQNGDPSSHYENFLKNYETGGDLPNSNPYHSMAAFKPNFCINFKTGGMWSTAMDASIQGAVSTISHMPGEIRASVEEIINNKLQSAGITITSSGVYFLGNFIGSMEGEISALGFNVLNRETKIPVLQFTTYDSSMGNPQGGEAPEEGTPVMIITHGGNTYLVNAMKLVTGGSSVQYDYVQAKVEDLYTTSYIGQSSGTQGLVTHHKLTAAPYLAVKNNNGQLTGLRIAAKLYNSSGTEVSWSTYLNKYYSGTLIQQDNDKTNLSEGIWAFKVTGSLANQSETFNGTPEHAAIAIYGSTTVVGTDSSGYPIHNYYDVYCTTSANLYKKIKIVNGVLSVVSYNRVCTARNIKFDNYGNAGSNTNDVVFISIPGYSRGAYHYSPSGEYTTSKYFALKVGSATETSMENINGSKALVGPISSTLQPEQSYSVNL